MVKYNEILEVLEENPLEQQPQFHKIVFYYDLEPEKNAILIKNHLSYKKMVLIISAIEIRFEELIGESYSMSLEQLAFILEKYFDSEVVTNQYQYLLPFTIIEPDEWEIVNRFNVGSEKKPFIINQIDWYVW